MSTVFDLWMDVLPPRRERKTTNHPQQLNEITTAFSPFHLGDHFGIVAPTGGGKSYFARQLLRHMRAAYQAPIFIIDSSEDDGFLTLPQPIVYEGERVPDVLQDNQHVHIWRPGIDDFDLYDDALRHIHQARRPGIVLIDETASLTAYGQTSRLPDSFIKLIKQGRKWGLSIIALAQEITRSNTVIFSQMTHYISFTLSNLVYEQSQNRRFLRLTEKEYYTPETMFGFWYKKRGMAEAVQLPSFEQLLGYMKENT